MGLAIGIALSLGAARWVEPLLFHESPRDLVVFSGVTLALLAVAAAASAIPAFRAARVDPQVALRVE